MSDYKLIPLTRGLYAKVDAADYEWLMRWKWTAVLSADKKRAYAKRNAKEKGKRVSGAMHRIILNAPKGMEVDHINRDTLDNRRANLRLCTKSQNQYNKIAAGKSSKYKGVSFHPYNRNWFAKIKAQGRLIHLGSFDREEDAALQYDRAAIEFCGEFVRLNFPDKRELVLKLPLISKAKTTSSYRGASKSSKAGKWAAYIYVKGKSYRLGEFDSEVEAARHHDRAAIHHFGESARLNFPDTIEVTLQLPIKEPKVPASGYRGVYPCHRSSKWQAVITRNGERRYLGVFDTPEEAAEAYAIAAKG